MRVLSATLCFVGVSKAYPDFLNPVFADNVNARLWRTALSGPSIVDDEQGWPHYTQGAYNNTPQESLPPGQYVKTDASGWTSGFFPDSLWQAYRRRTELKSRDDFPGEPSAEDWLSMADAWTSPLQTNANLTDTHDLGFLAKPFESAMRIQKTDAYLPVLQNMSQNLAARFSPAAGIIRSWDCTNGSSSSWCSHEDSVLVIIDNMMNLALLARSASIYTHNSTLLDIAISHADKTIQHHVRPDGSSYHVCDYSGTTGDAWGIYGFAEFYSFTRDPAYLATSKRMADWFIDHLPEDGLPFSDFDAEYLPNVTPRDSSAAAIAASGMLLLQQQIDESRDACRGGRDYKPAAEGLLRATVELALAGEVSFVDSPPIGAETYANTPANSSVSRGFESILMHATSNNNPRADLKNFDSGLSYGDFYFVEAGNRLLEWED